jgi:hypothetical protein
MKAAMLYWPFRGNDEVPRPLIGKNQTRCQRLELSGKLAIPLGKK